MEKFAAKEDLPESFKITENCTITFKDPDDTGSRQVHSWVTGAPGTGKTRAKNAL